MSVAVDNSQANEVVIRVDGRFDFTAHQSFRDAYTKNVRNGIRYVVDLGRTEYMDSSALGMLLQLREHAGGSKEGVRISHCRPEIAEILRISNFNKLFTID